MRYCSGTYRRLKTFWRSLSSVESSSSSPPCNLFLFCEPILSITNVPANTMGKQYPAITFNENRIKAVKHDLTSRH